MNDQCNITAEYVPWSRNAHDPHARPRVGADRIGSGSERSLTSNVRALPTEEELELERNVGTDAAGVPDAMCPDLTLSGEEAA